MTVQQSTRARTATARVLLAGLLLAGVVLSGCTSSATPNPHRLAAADGRPNIVFVLTDDLSTNLVRYMPHVQALMQQGTSFSHYFVVDSLCCPSRSALFTGEYPHDDGVFTNTGSDGGYHAFNSNGDRRKTFALALQHAGYRTALMGKYLNQYRPADPPQPGWDEWDVAGNGYPEFDYTLNQDGVDIDYGHGPQDYLTDVLANRAGRFIDSAAAGSKPFALEVATFAPHLPSTPAPQDARSFAGLQAPRGPTYDRLPQHPLPWMTKLPPLSAKDNRVDDDVFRRRVQSVQDVDRMIGHLEDRLKTDGLARNTYFVFSSDNGFHIGNYRLRPGKQTAFDTDIHVPLVVAGPGVPAGRTVDALASEIDLAPTYEQIGHAPPLAGTPDGVSLLNLWHGQPAPPGWQRAVLIEHHGHDFYPGDPDKQPILSGNPPTYEAIRTLDATYVEYRNGGREYYDLTKDPLELDNAATTAPPGVITPLHETLHALESCHGATQCQQAANNTG